MVGAMLAMSLLGSAVKVGSGAYKVSQAEKEAGKIPLAEVPDSAKQALAIAENQAKGRSAGAVEAERTIKETQASADYRSERGTTSGQQLQSAISSHQGTTGKNIRALQTQEAQDKERRMGVWENALWKMSGIEKEVDETNKANKYNTEQAIKASGQQEIFSGIQEGISAGMMNEMPTGGVESPAINKIAPKTIDNVGTDITPVGAMPMSKYQLYLASGSTISFTEWLKINK